MFWFWNGIQNSNVQTILNPSKMVAILNPIHWFCFRMCCTNISMINYFVYVLGRTIPKPKHSKSERQNVQILNVWYSSLTVMPKIVNVLNLAIFRLDFELWGKDRPCDGLRCDFKFEQPNTFNVQLDEDETVIRLVHFLQIFRNFAQRCLLDSTFHSPGVFGI